MKEKETLVLNTIKRIISRRKKAHCVPECALRLEIADKLKIEDKSLTDILSNLVGAGMIERRPTINDESFYLKGE